MLRNADHGATKGGLAVASNALHTGQNSGYQGVGLALAAGGAPVYLLGYDMKFDNGRSHWHPDHPCPVGESMYYVTFHSYFKELARALPRGTVVNCSPGSAMTCFPMSTIEEELA